MNRLVADGTIPERPLGLPSGPGANAVGPTETVGRQGSLFLRILLVLLDAATLLVAWLGAELLVAAAPHSLLVSAGALVVFPATGVCVYGFCGLYRARVCSMRSIESARLAQGCAVLSLIGVAAVAPLHGRITDVEIACAGTLSVLLGLLTRAGYRAWLGGRRRDGDYLRRVLLVGCGAESVELAALLTCHPELGYLPVGVVGDARVARRYDQLWCGDIDGVATALTFTGATGAIICTTALEPTNLNWVVDSLLSARAHVQLSSGLRGIDVKRLRRLPLAHEPLFYVEPVSLARWQLAVKRVLDLVIASVAFAAAAPILALAALAIRLEGGGSIVFRQVRVGRNGDRFVLLKLRSMRVDSESKLGALRDLNERDGPLLKIARDPRVSRLGRILRATSIDELPQLWNVLNGTMSLVGPRPALPDEVAQFDDEHRARDAVRPGITGLWQVEGRDNPSFAAYRRFDLHYLQNWTIGLDLRILGQTVEAVVVRVLRTVRTRGEDLHLPGVRRDSNAARANSAAAARTAAFVSTSSPHPRRRLEPRPSCPPGERDAGRRRRVGSRGPGVADDSRRARRLGPAMRPALVGSLMLMTISVVGVSWLSPAGDLSLGGPMVPRVGPPSPSGASPVGLPVQARTGSLAPVAANDPTPTTPSLATTPTTTALVATAPPGLPSTGPGVSRPASRPAFTPPGKGTIR